MRIRSTVAALLIACAAPALACEPPDEKDGAPWRHAVARVKLLPEVEAWANLMNRERTVVQYVVAMDEPRHVEGRCYWTVEVRAEGTLWRRYLVTPDGKRLMEAPAR